MEAVECGAASLTMILHYFGKYVPLEEVRAACGVSRDGAKASNILKAARNYGMEAKGFRKELSSLKETPLPVIIHWEFSHFVVLEGVQNDEFFLNDPASGRRIVPLEEFRESFTGITLTFTPKSEFKKSEKRTSLSSSLKSRLRGSEAALLYIVLLGLVLVIPGLAIPVFSRVFVDDILLGGMDSWLIPLLGGMALTAALRAILTWIQQYYLLRMETKIAISTSSGFLWHLLRLPTEFFTQRSAGEITSRMQGNDRVAKLLSGALADNVLNVIMIGFYFILMLNYHVVLAFVGLFFAIVNVLYLRIVSMKRKDLNRRLLRERGKVIGTSMGGLQIIETLKASGSESDFFSKWSGYQAKSLNAEQELGVSSQFLSVFPTFIAGLNNAVILGLGGLFILQGQMTIGMLVAFQSLMTSFMTPVKEMVGMGAELQEMEGEMNRLDDVLRYPLAPTGEEKSESRLSPNECKLEGYFELKQITFGYSTMEPPLIENFNLSLRPGSRVALVGGSGSGKSTVAKIMAGIHQPWSGEIIFDGCHKDSLHRGVITASLAMVDQEISMFQGTIRENITLWDDTVLELDLIHAAKDACIHEDITARVGGYDQPVEEGGKNFSGGQRQRLEIARALVQNPTIIIMDEATSALDSLTEKKVDENIRQRGCTCLIVAHRLSTIRDADEIIVLDKGKIIERGTHEELWMKGNVYMNLIKTE